MKTLKRLLSYRFHSLYPKKNKVFLPILFTLFFIGLSCNDQNGDDIAKPAGIAANPNSSSGNNGTGSKSINSALGIMYLENFNDPSRNQLAALLCDETYKKLIFQFYKLKTGKLTLVAFAVKQNGKDFNPNYQILGVVDDTVAADMVDKEVFMGDQKMENDSGFNMLKDAINKGSKNDTTKNYIIFTPDIKRFPPRGPSYVIEFTVSFSHSPKEIDPASTAPGNTRLNPSPPYSSRTF